MQRQIYFMHKFTAMMEKGSYNIKYKLHTLLHICTEVSYKSEQHFREIGKISGVWWN